MVWFIPVGMTRTTDWSESCLVTTGQLSIFWQYFNYFAAPTANFATKYPPLSVCLFICQFCHKMTSVRFLYLYSIAINALRFWWTESPPKSTQKSTLESRPAQKRTLESKSTLLSAQKSAHIFCLALKRAQEIAQKSKSLERALKRVGFSEKCAREWVTQKNEPL